MPVHVQCFSEVESSVADFPPLANFVHHYRWNQSTLTQPICVSLIIYCNPSPLLLLVILQRNQFDRKTMHWEGDRPGVCGQNYRSGDGQHWIFDDESDAGGDQTRDSHAATCHGASVYQWVYLFGWITTSARAATISWWFALADTYVYTRSGTDRHRDWQRREGGDWRDSGQCDKRTAGGCQSIKKWPSAILVVSEKPNLIVAGQSVGDQCSGEDFIGIL